MRPLLLAAFAALGGTGALAAQHHTYVLVHGAWGNGVDWRAVDSLLTLEGHRVVRVTLTGLGERVHLASAGVGLCCRVRCRDAVAGCARSASMTALTWLLVSAAVAGPHEPLRDSVQIARLVGRALRSKPGGILFVVPAAACPVLRDMDRLRGACGLCSFRWACGGSRARAYAMTGDVMETDPFCAVPPG